MCMNVCARESMSVSVCVCVCVCMTDGYGDNEV